MEEKCIGISKSKKISIGSIIFFILGTAVFFIYSSSIKESIMVGKPNIEDLAQKTFETCASKVSNATEHEKCVAGAFADVGEKWGVIYIADLLTAYQALNKEGPSGYQDCHILAHRIMNDLGSRESNKWDDLLDQMNDSRFDQNRCGGGFLHGLLEVKSGQDPDFKINVELFNELCGVKLRQSSSCAHILGHLSLVEVSGKVEEALKVCNGLSGDFLFQCYGGIFMEDTMRTNLHDHGLADLPVRDIQWFQRQSGQCTKYSSEPQMISGCWYVLSEVFMQTHSFDLEKTYQFCKTAPTEDAQDRCYMRASYLFALLPDYILVKFPADELCATYDSENIKIRQCMNDVVSALISYSTKFTDRAISFCSAREDSVHNQCFTLIADYLSHSSEAPAQRKVLCSKLPLENQSACMSPN